MAPRPSPTRASPVRCAGRVGSRPGRFLGGMVRSVPDDRPGARGDLDASLATRLPSPRSTSTRIPTLPAAMACAASRPCCCSRMASRSRKRSALLPRSQIQQWLESNLGDAVNSSAGLRDHPGARFLRAPRVRVGISRAADVVSRIEPGDPASGKKCGTRVCTSVGLIQGGRSGNRVCRAGDQPERQRRPAFAAKLAVAEA